MVEIVLALTGNSHISEVSTSIWRLKHEFVIRQAADAAPTIASHCAWLLTAMRKHLTMLNIAVLNFL